jgi:hypothetical protein
MPRNKGTFKFAASYEVREAYPLDPRMLVETKQELITQDTWPTKDTTIYVYNGLLVSVQEEKAVYMLVDKTKILNEDYSGWKRIDGSQGEPTIIPQESTYLIDSFTILDIDEQISYEGTLKISFNLLKEAIKNNKIILIKKDWMNSVILCNCYEVETDEEPYYIIETLCNNYFYKIKILDDTIYASDIEIIEIGSNNGGVDTYVLEFNIEDLQGLAYGNIDSLDFNINNLRQAVIDNKVVLINYYKTHGEAAIPCACYSEDTDAEFRIEILLEKKIITISIDLIGLEGDVVTIYTKDITITELQEKLKSGTNIKTINSESILGKGNIEIELPQYEMPDWNAQKGEPGFIKNKPFEFVIENGYSKEVIVGGGEKTVTLLTLIYNEDNEAWYWDGADWLSENPVLRVSIPNENFIIVKTSDLPVEEFGTGLYKDLESGDIMYSGWFDGETTIKVELTDTISQISECFIPDTIVRKSDLEDIGGSSITVDDQLSEGSTNPVQNKVITEELNKKANAIDIPKNVSELKNDSDFITADVAQQTYQPKGEYLTETELTEKGYIKDVDAELSDTSENPVQNKAINAELKKKIEGEIEYVLPVSGMGVVPKDLVLATPSGDPMHYMYIAAGADYNATESDIEKEGEYKDTIIHKKGCWYLNEVGDLTNEEMRLIYEDGFHTRKPNGGYPMFFQDLEHRTFLNRTDFQDRVRTTYSFSRCTKALVIRTGKDTTTIYEPTGMFDSCERVIKILGVMICASQIIDSEIRGMFNRCYALQEVKLKSLHRNISLKDSSEISKNSILYMIENAVDSGNKITITLHEDAYNRLIDDEEISNAINAHGNIALSKPENN